MNGRASLRGFFFFPHRLWQDSLRLGNSESSLTTKKEDLDKSPNRRPIGLVNRDAVKGWWLHTHELDLLDSNLHANNARWGVISKVQFHVYPIAWQWTYDERSEFLTGLLAGSCEIGRA